MKLAILAFMCFNVASAPEWFQATDANKIPIYTMSDSLQTSDRKATPINLEPQDIPRFWSKVDVKSEDECWLWTAARFNQGYGAFKVKGKMLKASRVAFFLSRGEIPDRMLVCHECNNPPCCNPKHLFAGTYDDNMKHMVECGRSLVGDLNPIRKNPNFAVRGERHASSRLTTEKVLDIRKRFADKTATLTSLAREHDVTKQSIYAIVYRKTWTHI